MDEPVTLPFKSLELVKRLHLFDQDNTTEHYYNLK